MQSCPQRHSRALVQLSPILFNVSSLSLCPPSSCSAIVSVFRSGLRKSSVKRSGFSGDMEQKKKPLNSQLWRKASLANVSASDEIPTPEKPAQLPRRDGKRKLSFSVSDVRKVAMGLRITRNTSANPSDLPKFDDELQRKSQSRFDSAATSSAEAISIKKVLLRDEATCCMKPELQVSLQVDAVERNLELKGESPYSALRKVFRDRLVQFAREHPEEDDIPEETLPHPFGRTNPSMSTEFNKLAPSIRTGSLSEAHPAENLTKVSHFSASFQRRFSTRTPCSDEMRTPLASVNDVATNVDSLASSFPSPVKFSSKLPICKKPLFSSPGKRPLVIHDQQIEEDSKVLMSAHNSISSEVKSLESTPVKDILSPARLMITTPDLQTRKRSHIPSTDDTPQKALVKRATRTKLFPTPRKNVKSDGEDNLSESSPVEDDVLGFLPQSLLSAPVEHPTPSSTCRLCLRQSQAK